MPIVTKIRGFKPEFGNETHLRILEEVKLLNKDIVARDQLVKDRRDSAALRFKIAERKKKIRSMIDFANKQAAKIT